METNLDEKVLFTADDDSVTLTNQRVISKTNESSKEILFKDYIGYEIVNERQRFFLYAIVVFIVLMVIVNSAYESEGVQFKDRDASALCFFGAVASAFLYFVRTKKMLHISGKHIVLKFFIGKISNNSLNSFLETLTKESNKIKNS